MKKQLIASFPASIRFLALGICASLAIGLNARAQTVLSDVPVFSASTVPANLLLALSVEFPTGTVAAYTDASGFASASAYLGYFDSAKCYSYQADAVVPLNNYFVPAGAIGGTGCPATQWSGNLLNWASMTALDEFRQTLTGGMRVVDMAGLTVLQRSRQTAQGSAGNFPTKSVAAPAGLVATPFAAGAVWMRTHNGGTELTSGTDRGVFLEVSNNSGFNTGSGNISRLFYARVKVCDSSAGLEANCTRYGTGYKPEGLIQQNANRIRVGAVGYYNRNGTTQPNGVLRAPVRDVGPTSYNGFAARTANSFAEWDGSTGVFTTNPDPASATAWGVPNSGAINYLNKFGYASPTGYMTYDTISELYWAALSHYMQVPLDATYTAGVAAGAGQLDGFPAVSSTVLDPEQYSCAANSIAVIGDSHTWCDSRVPGGGPDASGSNGCSNQGSLAAVNGLDAAANATALGALPLLEANSGNTYSPTTAVYLPGTYRTALGTQRVPSGAGAATYDIAGMAYWAHVKDIRPDNASLPGTIDKQTVDTYVIDVMEPGRADNSGAGNATFDPNNLGSRGPQQYWLAAKYGGFDDINNDGQPANYLSWHTNQTSGTNTRPDNLFPGNRPDAIRSGLATIFDRVASKKILSASGAGTDQSGPLNAVDLTIYNTSVAGFAVYTPKYKPADWKGDVIGQIATTDASGNVVPVMTAGPPPVPAAQWSAQVRLDGMTQRLDASNNPTGWSTIRRVITSNGSGTGAEFRWSAISTAQKTALNNDSSLLDFLRGDRTKEGTQYHLRKSVLGDIVGSNAVLVQGARSPIYSDAANAGYSAFKTSQASRAPVIYVGANDGMLHAFAADFSAPTTATAPNGGGSELFAYVPSFLFAGPNTTPSIDGLAALANLNGVTTNPYKHHFYVDQTPRVDDIDFDKNSTTPGGSGNPNWHTVLVSAVGKGGKGVFALDVTTVPAALSAGTSTAQETLIKSKVLWEFTNADMGYLYGQPVVAKTRKYGWVVLITTGYDNASGIGKLFVLNARTGALLETLSNAVGSATNPSGLGRAKAYVKDVSDNTVEQVYAGDLKGNVWRFDLSGTGTWAAPTLLATLTAPDNTPQPITSAPRIETDVDSTGLGTRRWVFVGTGKFVDISDISDTQVQSMYALRDGRVELPSCTTASAGVCVGNPNGLPLTRAGMIAITNLAAGANIPDSAEGWYYDLPGKAGNVAGGATERIIIDPVSLAGYPLIAWATLVPTSDPCSYQGAIYAVAYGTGKTALVDAGGAAVTSIVPTGGAPTGIQLINAGPNGTAGPSILVTTLGSVSLETLHLSPDLNLYRTNWREVLN